MVHAAWIREVKWSGVRVKYWTSREPRSCELTWNLVRAIKRRKTYKYFPQSGGDRICDLCKAFVWYVRYVLYNTIQAITYLLWLQYRASATPSAGRRRKISHHGRRRCRRNDRYSRTYRFDGIGAAAAMALATPFIHYPTWACSGGCGAPQPSRLLDGALACLNPPTPGKVGIHVSPMMSAVDGVPWHRHRSAMTAPKGGGGRHGWGRWGLIPVVEKKSIVPPNLLWLNINSYVNIR